MVLLGLMKLVAQNLCHLGGPLAGVHHGSLSNNHGYGRWLLNSFLSFNSTHLGSGLRCNFHVSRQWWCFPRAGLGRFGYQCGWILAPFP